MLTGLPSIDDEPRFVIRAQDRLAVMAVIAYHELCCAAGLYEQARQVKRAINEMRQWRANNPDRVKNPDHTHVPVGG